MNKEEAIKDLKTLKEFFEERSGAVPLSIEYAIEKLDQKPCDDCISRQAAIAVADYADYTGLAIEDVKMVTDEIVKGLKQLPSVTPAERVGHWIEERTYMECPKCHDIWHYEENQTERFKYCPNCGAKMQEVEE